MRSLKLIFKFLYPGQPEASLSTLPFFNLKRILYKTAGRYIGMIISIFPPTSPLLAPLLFGYSSFADQTPRRQRPHGCQTPRRSYDSGRMGASYRGEYRRITQLQGRIQAYYSAIPSSRGVYRRITQLQGRIQAYYPDPGLYTGLLFSSRAVYRFITQLQDVYRRITQLQGCIQAYYSAPGLYNGLLFSFRPVYRFTTQLQDVCRLIT